jgi:hypothetical protein
MGGELSIVAARRKDSCPGGDSGNASGSRIVTAVYAKMILDVIDRRPQLIVSESAWSGKRESDFRVVAQNSRTRRIEQSLNKEIRCRVLDSRRNARIAGRRSRVVAAPNLHCRVL